jgi:hypothetical protein
MMEDGAAEDEQTQSRRRRRFRSIGMIGSSYS